MLLWVENMIRRDKDNKKQLLQEEILQIKISENKLGCLLEIVPWCFLLNTNWNLVANHNITVSVGRSEVQCAIHLREFFY